MRSSPRGTRIPAANIPSSPAAGGEGVAFIFAWSRMTVIQTGAIAARRVRVRRLRFRDFSAAGATSSAIWAAHLGRCCLRRSTSRARCSRSSLQKVMETCLIGRAGRVLGRRHRPSAARRPKRRRRPGGSARRAFGFAMIFVLLAYGGWNEAAYLAGEVRDAAAEHDAHPRRRRGRRHRALSARECRLSRRARSSGVRDSKAVAADVMRAIAGDKGAVSALADRLRLGTDDHQRRDLHRRAHDLRAGPRLPDVPRGSARWREKGSTPANALLVQGVITLVLVAASAALTPDGFNAMVAYTSPVFWTFFLLTGLTLFVFRRKGGEHPAFRVPLYPVVPAAFCLMCAYMLYSSIDYVRFPLRPEFGFAVAAGLSSWWQAFRCIGFPGSGDAHRAALHRRRRARAPLRPRGRGVLRVAADAFGGGEEARGGARPGALRARARARSRSRRRDRRSSRRRSACWRKRRASRTLPQRGAIRSPGRCVWGPSTRSGRTSCPS